MTTPLNTTQQLAEHLSKYLTITGFDAQKTYTYKKRDNTIWKTVSVHMHRPKQKPASILYMALDSEANLKKIKSNDLLYVGSLTQDRMFRGDGLRGTNFHHREMRLGHNGKNLEMHLASGRRVTIYTITGDHLKKLAPEASVFTLPCPTARQPHPGYSVEQLILLEGHSHWAWNSDGPDSLELVNGLTFINNHTIA